MQGCSSLTDVGLHAMGGITSLVSVNLQDCTDITGELDSPAQFLSSVFLAVLSSQPCSMPLALW